MANSADRGVSTLIGFILLFGFLIISFSIYQGVVVPNQNSQAEFEHNKEVQDQLQNLRNGIVNAGFSGAERSITIDLAATYPQRTLAVNLAYSGGGVSTVTYDNAPEFSINNTNATDLYGEAGDYWNGTQRNYSTKAFQFRPVYARYNQAPETIYENTLLYNHFESDANISLTDQALIKGDRITLISLVGNLSRSGQGSVSVDIDAVSTSTRTVSVRNSTDQRINITIPTRLNQSWWNDTLEDDGQLDEDGGHVVYVNDTGKNQISIILEQNVTYRLRMAKVGVGSGVEGEDAAYLTLVDRPSGTVFNDSSQFITLEVRDRYNNPVSGVEVSGSINTTNEFEGDGTIKSTANGRVQFEYNAPSTADTEKLTFDIGSSEAKTVSFNLTVRESA